MIFVIVAVLAALLLFALLDKLDAPLARFVIYTSATLTALVLFHYLEPRLT